jgi:hypothetical protein
VREGIAPTTGSFGPTRNPTHFICEAITTSPTPVVALRVNPRRAHTATEDRLLTRDRRVAQRRTFVVVRSKRNQHQALDALAFGIGKRRCLCLDRWSTIRNVFPPLTLRALRRAYSCSEIDPVDLSRSTRSAPMRSCSNTFEASGRLSQRRGQESRSGCGEDDTRQNFRSAEALASGIRNQPDRMQLSQACLRPVAAYSSTTTANRPTKQQMHSWVVYCLRSTPAYLSAWSLRMRRARQFKVPENHVDQCASSTRKPHQPHDHCGGDDHRQVHDNKHRVGKSVFNFSVLPLLRIREICRHKRETLRLTGGKHRTRSQRAILSLGPIGSERTPSPHMVGERHRWRRLKGGNFVPSNAYQTTCSQKPISARTVP